MSGSTPHSSSARVKLGEILVASGALNEAQLQQALAEQGRVKRPLGQVLFQMKLVTDETLRRALGRQLDIPFVDLDKMTLDRGLAKLVGANYARRRMIVPVARIGTTLTIAMDDPTASAVIDELHRLTHYTITVVTSTSAGIRAALDQLYGEAAESPNAASSRPAAIASREVREPREVAAPDSGAIGAPRDDLVAQILSKALENHCSDIHLEMLPAGLHVRFRIDGVLRQPRFGALQKVFDTSMREIVSRIKILAKLDIAERRRPQDGSFRTTVLRQGKPVTVDLRVSVVPSYTGESVVIRILDRTRAPHSIEQLALSPAAATRLGAVLQRTSGIFLVTGPTGSGKTTTLYACLMRLHRPEIRILTAEDPVEYVYDELSQTEVNEAIGNTFAAFLRVFLRHDPEVIMVGEIRDQETAEMAFRAAQTGHLLLSTLHTNSALAALPRLRDLNIESSLIASSLIGVMSQRLARKVCEHCRENYTPPADVLAAFFRKPPSDWALVHGAGCAACGGSGYKGRMMITDLWIPDDEDFVLIARSAPLDEVKQSAERTILSMAQDAHERLRTGQTTLEELLRVLPYSAVSEHRARFGG